MKCLNCNNAGVYTWWLSKLDFEKLGVNILGKFEVDKCFCSKCHAKLTSVELDNLLITYWKTLQPITSKETPMTLKFPNAEDYPEGFNWFAYDEDGRGFFYKNKPSISLNRGDIWTNEGVSYFQHAEDFYSDHDLENWKETLRSKSQAQQATSSHYYKWHPVSECIKISEQFPSNLGQAMQYIWRANVEKVTKGQTKEQVIEDLYKAIDMLKFEIERIGK